MAYQGYFALRPAGGIVAGLGERGGARPAGRGSDSGTRPGAICSGNTVPSPPGTAQSGRLEEARRWMELADSALKMGDWSEFGRAWNTLRSVLGLPLDTMRF